MIKFTGLTWAAPQVVNHLYFEESDGSLTQTPGTCTLDPVCRALALKPDYKALLDQRGAILAERL